MFRILIDTCVWLDIAKDYRQSAILEALETLLDTGQIILIIPQTVIDEFARNKARVATESSRSVSSALKRAKDIVGTLGEGKGKRLALAHLDEIDFRLPRLGESAIGSIGRIEAIFTKSTAIDTTNDILLLAAQRAVDGRAPFHRNRNSVNDAILIEVYSAQLAMSEPRVRYAFVTHNIKDFSDPSGDDRHPHPDLAHLFSRIRSRYSVSLAETIRRVDPGLLGDIVVEQEWAPEPRRLAEVLQAIDECFDKVWYGRHGGLRQGVESGSIAVVDRETYPRDPANPTVQRDVWRKARQAAQRVERRYGIEDLGPWDDFEWGMLNGKLSALRWVVGDDWDMPDT